MTWIIYKHIDSPFILILYVKFGFDWPRGFREEDLWTDDDGDNGWMLRTCLSYKLTSEASAQVSPKAG